VKKYKNNINEEPKAHKISAKGMDGDMDQTDASLGRAEFLLKQVSRNLRGLGFDVDDLAKQKPIAQLMAAPFGIDFSLKWPEKNEWGETGLITNINGKEIGKSVDTRAKVLNPKTKNGGLLIETKNGLKIEFIDEKELNRTLGGGEGKLPPGKKGENYRRILEEGIVYKVKIDKGVEVGSEDSNNEEPNKDGEDNQNTEENKDKQKTEYLNIPKPKLQQLNTDLEKLKTTTKKLSSLKLNKFVNNDTFLLTFIGNILNTKTSNIKINGEPIAVMLKKLKTNGLLEEPKRSRDINDKLSLPSGWENMVSLFFERLFKLYSKLHKCCKEQSDTYIQIKKLFNLIYLILKQGQSNIKDKQKLKKLSKKLVGTFSNFVNEFTKTDIEFSNKKQNEDIIKDNSKLLNELFNVLKEEGEEETKEDTKQIVQPDYILMKINSIETMDEGPEDVEARKSGSNKKIETDAIIISSIGSSIQANGTFSIPPGKQEQEVLPGAGNKKLSDEPLKCYIQLLKSDDGKTITTDSKIEIKEPNDKDIKGIDELNRSISEVIKSGKMTFTKSGENIVLKYPSTSKLTDRINNVWSQS